MKAGRLIAAHLPEEDRPNLGIIKYSCFKRKKVLADLNSFRQRLALTPERCSDYKVVRVRKDLQGGCRLD